ncbi:hypothetical protein MKK75_19300 [Methylobacterium sp. J-030]|uniref:hypothetical protein n=1 Tax=Methylobacterium sp. J-030 TaxID=2836627 RepID=UPI001FBA7620|nr:hypothetical protein [Methylobacterium sp. J-030]MCJ2070910.1 hypothetical protein [Methylobacterium sp. J-030]
MPTARQVALEYFYDSRDKTMVRSPLALSAAFAAFATLALTASVQAQTKPGEIKGFDAMGDKDRSAQDGWSQAPVPREESAAKDAPNPGGKSVAQNKDRPVPAAPTTYKPGEDPQAPVEQQAAAPSGNNPTAPSK